MCCNKELHCLRKLGTLRVSCVQERTVPQRITRSTQASRTRQPDPWLLFLKVREHLRDGSEFVHVVEGVLAIHYQSEDHILLRCIRGTRILWPIREPGCEGRYQHETAPDVSGGKAVVWRLIAGHWLWC